jgi:hypothetical protein
MMARRFPTRGYERDDRAELVLKEESSLVRCARRIVPVGSLPQQVAGDCEDSDPDRDIDQQRQISLVELMPVEQNNSGDLAANGNDPTERGEKAEARGWDVSSSP